MSILCYLNFCNFMQCAMHTLKLSINVLRKKYTLTGLCWYFTSLVLVLLKYHSLIFKIRYTEGVYFMYKFKNIISILQPKLDKSTTAPRILLLTLYHGKVVIYFIFSSAESWGFSFWQVLFAVLIIEFCINSVLIVLLHWWDLC